MTKRQSKKAMRLSMIDEIIRKIAETYYEDEAEIAEKTMERIFGRLTELREVTCHKNLVDDLRKNLMQSEVYSHDDPRRLETLRDAYQFATDIEDIFDRDNSADYE